MKIAIAQLNPTIGDLVGNARQIQVAAEQAENQGVRLLLTPELSLCGYPPRDLLFDASFVEAMAHNLEQLAQSLPAELAVLVGTVESNPNSSTGGGKPLFNTMAWLEHGQVRQTFHKRLLPTYDVFDEDRYFSSGHNPNVLVLDGLNIGVTICEDLWNDEEFWGRRTYAIDPVAELIHQNVDLIVNLSASPFCVGKQRLREAILQHTVQRYQRPIIYINQVGGNDDLIFDGRSLALNRQGDLVGRGKAFDSDLLILTVDPHTKDLQPDRLAPSLDNDNAEIWSALVLGVRDYARKCGFSDAVIGLSGGIDSSLVAAIAAAALGPEHVLGVLMPSPYSSDHSIRDAQDLATNLGIATKVIPIADLMHTYDQSLASLFSGTTPGVAEENIQARIRGNLLMAIANKFGRLLISTGNKSEMAVGYCTLYGDMSGGLAAIADVPKTRVYDLCHWLNSDSGSQVFQQQTSAPEASAQEKPHWSSLSRVHIANSIGAASASQRDTKCETFPQEKPKPRLIPPHILSKPPSAELKPDQVDQDSLPPYDVLDDILNRLIDQHQSCAQIVAAGHESATVERIIQMVKRAEFKRRQAPPGLKITDRAFGTGWRMPIAARMTTIQATQPAKIL